VEERKTKALVTGNNIKEIFEKVIVISSPSETDFKKFSRVMIKDFNLAAELRELYNNCNHTTATTTILRQHVSQASDEAIEFIKSCLQLLPSSRKKYEELEQLPFLLSTTTI
jgi:hypothetical protein